MLSTLWHEKLRDAFTRNVLHFLMVKNNIAWVQRACIPYHVPTVNRVRFQTVNDLMENFQSQLGAKM